MKKTLIALVAIAITGFATPSFSQTVTLTLKNTTTCGNVDFVVHAHDCSLCTHSGHCALNSNVITLGTGGSVTYTYVTDLNTTPGWQSSITASGGSGSDWDGVSFGSGPGCIQAVGVNACISTATSNVLTCTGCTYGWDGYLSVDSHGNITVTVTDYN